MSSEVDLFIIGAGINGAGIAADASGRGLKVVICESHDIASGTSSYSSKLIHGGLRYLEQYEFGLVRKALHEREVLLSKAPHLITPLELVLPHDKYLRPVWMLRLGLFLYDHLARRKRLPKSRKLNLANCTQGKALKSSYQIGFSYADCTVDDARLVVGNVKAASDHGAIVLTRTTCVKAERVRGVWQITIKNTDTDVLQVITAKALVNAGGPWVSQLIRDVIHTEAVHHIKLVKGSHIVIPKLYKGRHAYILQNADGRIVFVIPYQTSFTLVGTTDIPFEGDPRRVAISEEEKKYLCKTINGYFNRKTKLDDIVWHYSGVRPLYDDKEKNLANVTRDYRLELEDDHGQAPLLSIFGGKLTTYRQLAENALAKLQVYFPRMTPAWTANKPLPGGDIVVPMDQYVKEFKASHAWLPASLAERYVRSYGTVSAFILNGATGIVQLGKDFGAGLHECEVTYLIEHEWALSAEDILWRRSKLGLKFTPEETAQLQAWIHTYLRRKS